MLKSTSPHSSITTMIEQGKIYDAISALQSLPTAMPAAEADRLREAEMIYSSMLRYFESGAPDPSRSDLLNNISETLYEINDAMQRLAILPTAPGKYFSTARMERLKATPEISELVNRLTKLADDIEPLLALEQYPAEWQASFDSSLVELFNKIWINISLRDSDAAAIHSLIKKATDSDMLLLAAANILSALTLSALEYYDPRKLEILLNVYASGQQPQLEARAIVGATLIMQMHPSRITGKSIKDLSEAAADKPTFRKEIDLLVKAMLRTRDTDRVNRKMQHEIFPDLMKLRPEIEKRIKGIDPSSLADDEPELMELIDKSGINSKLREITEMQMEGADIFMGAFAGMKKFPFFSEISHWLLPFNINHSEIHEALGRLPQGLAQLMLSAPVFCASDKYSLALAMARMPQAQASMMATQMQTQFNALSEEQRASLEKSLETNFETEINIYLKDLFRLYRLPEFRQELHDPFEKPFELPATTLFASLKDDLEMQRLIADFYFKYGYFSLCVPIYRSISESIECEADDMKKLGYALEKTNQAQAALDAYRQAELIDEPDTWLLKRIAATLRATGKYAEAADAYAKVLAVNPDNLRIELLRAHTLLEAGNPKAALKSYYKVDYMEPESGKASRGIAWCEFLIKNYDKSIARYKRITESDDASSGDYLNYGHVLFVSGRIAEAAATYRVVKKIVGIAKAQEMLTADTGTLLKAGIPPLSIRLMTDFISR